jgi:hypothetical protein
MTIAVFDTLQPARRLEKAGMPAPQAEGFAEMRTAFARPRMKMAQSKTETIRSMVGLFVAQISITLGVLLRLAG